MLRVNAPLRVLFLCTHNASRSQLAEALLRHLSKGRVEVHSAGSSPAATIHPQARAVLEDAYGLDTSGLSPKPLTDFTSERFDFVITVCDQAAEQCPVFPGGARRLHWSFEDPSLEPDAASQRRACERVANGLVARLRIWLALPETQSRMAGG
jgi:arsenate reductase